MAETRLIRLRRRLAIIFEDEEPRSVVTRLFNTMLALLIIVNVAAVGSLRNMETPTRRVLDDWQRVRSSANGMAPAMSASAAAMRSSSWSGLVRPAEHLSKPRADRRPPRRGQARAS